MDVADIHALAHNVGGWLIVIEGVAEMYTDTPALVGSGASSWIGTGFGARTVKLGLKMPAELPFGETDPWSSTIRSPAATAFTILDFDGSVAALFVDYEPDETTDTLGRRLSPLDDPAPDPAVGLDEEVITLWDRCVGIERIGPEGERRHFWIAPDDFPPGLDHPAATGWPPSRVTDTPTVWAGRKIALYRIVKDPDFENVWHEWDSQYAGGSLWWYGTLTDRGEWKEDADGRAFVLYAHGPASWQERSANLARPTTWYFPTSGVALAGDELLVSVWIEPVEWEDLGEGINYARTKYRSFTLRSGHDLTGLSTVTEIWEQIRDIAYATVDGTDYGTVVGADIATWTGPTSEEGLWNDGAGEQLLRLVRIASDGHTIEIKCEPAAPKLGFRLAIAADVRVWQLAGWDISAAEFLPRSHFNGECPVGGANWGESAGDEVLPPYHVVGLFSTRNEQTLTPQSQWDNNGNWKIYQSKFPAGTIILDHEGGTEFFLGVDPAQVEGQHGNPFTLGSQIDSVDVDAAGWWIFRGQLLTAAQYLAGNVEGAEHIAVALCEWVATTDRDGVEVNDEGVAALRIVRWEDPRAFGLPYDRFGEPWVNAVNALECAPLGVIGGMEQGGPGWRHRLIPTALLSSGTAEWDDTGGSVTITPGVNHPGDMPPLEIAGDLEVADLGCGLPAVFVDWASWYAAALALPGGVYGALNRVLYVLFGSEKISTVLREAMAGAGWAWSLARVSGGVVPAFGCFDPLRLISPDDVVATLRRTDIAELTIEDRPQWRGTIELRRGGPYDRFVFEVGKEPIDAGGKPYQQIFESHDPGRRARAGRIDWPVKDSGLRDPAPWLAEAQAQQYDWTGHARERFAAGFGTQLAKQQRIYRAVYNSRFAGVLGLGSPVHVVDSTAESPDGTRGINHRGRVIECSIVAKGTGAGSVRVAIELERQSVDQVHVWGPYGVSGVGGWASGSLALTIYEDHGLVGGAHTDAIGWTKPSWSGFGAGNLDVVIYQCETGADFDDTLTRTAEIASVAGLVLTLQNLSGTLLRDSIKVIVAGSLDDQGAEWAQRLFAPVTAPNGLYNGTDKGVRLK